LLRHDIARVATGLWSNSHWPRRGVTVRGMDLPPGSSNERRHLPRHIRDGEHEPWQDAGEIAAGAARPGRRRLVLLCVVLIAALVVGLWFYNGAR
jgi:hypothetical protein